MTVKNYQNQHNAFAQDLTEVLSPNQNGQSDYYLNIINIGDNIPGTQNEPELHRYSVSELRHTKSGTSEVHFPLDIWIKRVARAGGEEDFTFDDAQAVGRLVVLKLFSSKKKAA